MWAAGVERLAIDGRGLEALKARAGANDPTALSEAARQFEALLVQTLLREMREARFSTADDRFADSETMRLYRELLDQQWAQKIVQRGGLGFAEAMTRQLERQQAVAGQPDAPTGNSARLPASGQENMEPALREQTAWSQGGSAPATAASAIGRAAEAAPAASAPQDAIQARKAQFIERLRPHAEAAAQATGVPAAFILAHAALESGWGAREVRWADGRSTHNLFGIKAGASWRGEIVESETLEYRQGLPLRVNERFRAYDDYAAAFADYAQLLRARYATAVQAGDDAQAFAQALAAGGYATDPGYAGKLMGVIASVARLLA
ncbi:MAG: flagellar assembly peptidoglycan hydrolase FlgJ [Thiobacillaceae bacterium]